MTTFGLSMHAHGGTYIHMNLLLLFLSLFLSLSLSLSFLSPRRCLYHLQRPSCRQRGRVPCRYSLSRSTVPRMIHVISLPEGGYRPPKRQRNDCLTPDLPFTETNGPLAYIGIRSARTCVTAIGFCRGIRSRKDITSPLCRRRRHVLCPWDIVDGATRSVVVVPALLALRATFKNDGFASI